VVTSPREGIFRLRLGSPEGAPYPILTFDQMAPALPLEVVDDETSITIAAGELSLTVRKSPVDFELNWCGRTLTRAITDKHFRGWTRLPVIGVPVRSRALQGIDSLLSIVQMPRGIPVATVAIGKSGAVNAALLAAAILANKHSTVAATLEKYRAKQTADVLEQPDPRDAR